MRKNAVSNSRPIIFGSNEFILVQIMSAPLRQIKTDSVSGCEIFSKSSNRLIENMNKCAFYGYLPSRNGARALTSRSGNVGPVQWKASGRTQTSFRHVTFCYRAFCFAFTSGYGLGPQRELQMTLLFICIIVKVQAQVELIIFWC